MALVACPTSSIGTLSKADVSAAARALPEPIDNEVHYCGYAAESSFGASSYLIRRPRGNVLVDSPRAARPLLRRLEELGGVRHLFLTHRDDVADHARFRDHFGCERILHRADLAPGTAAIERPLDGSAPIRLDDDLVANPVPGHTRGSTALLYRNRYLFTGDHLWASEDDGALEASRGVCWYSWPEQIRSMERLADFEFEWVLPGHGRRYHAQSPSEMRAAIRQLAVAMKRRG
jgi:glyoxylase-like metal-dependent hydrolase (beta-lactamase superfamily II)